MTDTDVGRNFTCVLTFAWQKQARRRRAIDGFITAEVHGRGNCTLFYGVLQRGIFAEGG